MKKLIACVAAVASLALTGCAAPDVEVKHQGEYQLLEAHKSYAVVDHTVGSTPTTRLAFNTKIHPVMNSKGYARVPAGEADLLVSFKSLWRSDKRNAKAQTSSDKPSLQDAFMGMENPQGDVEKVVLVTLEEAKTDRVVWVGWTNVEVGRDRVIMSISSSLDEILARIPARN